MIPLYRLIPAYSAPQPRGIQCQNLIYLIYYLWMNKQVNHADTQTNQNKQRKPSPVSEIVIDSRKHHKGGNHQIIFHVQSLTDRFSHAAQKT